MGGAAVALGAQHAAEALGFFLAASERTRNLDKHVGVRQVDSEVTDLRDHEVLLRARTEGSIELFAFLVRRLAGNQRNLEVFGERFELVDVLADDEHAVIRLAEVLEQAFDDVRLFGVRACERNLVAHRSESILHLEFRIHRDADFVTVGSCNPALCFQDAPRDVELFRSNQAEHFSFLVVFTDERCRKAQAARGLHFGTQAEHRSREQVDFVVNHEAPLFLAKEREVCKFLLDLFFGHFRFLDFLVFVALLGAFALRQNLVGGDRHRADFFDFAGVFLDLVECKVRLVADFADPLAG